MQILMNVSKKDFFYIVQIDCTVGKVMSSGDKHGINSVRHKRERGRDSHFSKRNIPAGGNAPPSTILQ